MIDWSEIFTEASFWDPNESKLRTTWSEPNSVWIGDRVGRIGPNVEDFQDFSEIFRPDEHRMRCWPHTTLSNIMRFPNPPNRRSGRPIRTNLLTIFIFFLARWAPNATPNVDRSGGRGFNLSALYALLMLVYSECSVIVSSQVKIQNSSQNPIILWVSWRGWMKEKRRRHHITLSWGRNITHKGGIEWNITPKWKFCWHKWNIYKPLET